MELQCNRIFACGSDSRSRRPRHRDPDRAQRTSAARGESQPHPVRDGRRDVPLIGVGDGGCWDLVGRAKDRLGFRPTTYGADKGFFAAEHVRRLVRAHIEPHIAIDRGKQPAYTAVRPPARGLGYQLSQRARKKIEELFGEAKDWHGFTREAPGTEIDRSLPAERARAAAITRGLRVRSSWTTVRSSRASSSTPGPTRTASRCTSSSPTRAGTDGGPQAVSAAARARR